jgi:acetoacetate decarboxylase
MGAVPAMPRGKIIYVAPAAHRRLKLLAARRGRPMGEVVADLIDQELADLTNPWTAPEGLWLQQKALTDVWSDPALDVYDDPSS